MFPFGRRVHVMYVGWQAAARRQWISLHQLLKVSTRTVSPMRGSRWLVTLLRCLVLNRYKADNVLFVLAILYQFPST
jgi:hypothetical protein